MYGYTCIGTRHITLETLRGLTSKEAARVFFDDLRPQLPVTLPMDHFKQWGRTPCIALGLGSSTTEFLCAALFQLRGLVGLPPSAPRPKVDRSENLHISLYRRRSMNKEAVTRAFDHVRARCEGEPRGSVRVVRVAIKRLGADYTESRVLA